MKKGQGILKEQYSVKCSSKHLGWSSSLLISSNGTEEKDPQSFLKNKFEQLSAIINGNIYIFIIYETKLDETFLAAVFFVKFLRSLSIWS